MTSAPDSSASAGWGIQFTAERLRNYAWIERACVKITAGWWLAVRPYEHKYALAYHLYDHSEHVTWLRHRLEEMRGGRPGASVRPGLKQLMDEALHAPDEASFLRGFYGVIKRALLAAYRADLEKLDPAANANEARLFERIVADLEKHVAWFESPGPGSGDAWADYLASLLRSIGGIQGDEPADAPLPRPHAGLFTRPKTILFDNRIQRQKLMPYDDRSQLSPREATIEQFKVFFNEMYAAALLASILFDAAEDDVPWDFHRDFSRHFWDEARHSQFGAIRLREIGAEPDRCDPILFEQSEALPVLHRITYLTRGLEAYFMPRKPKRFKEYEQHGDARSQLFADQDWSDEINHVRYGSTWTDFLLKDDSREVEDVIEEVKEHLGKISGKPVAGIEAPF
jgi:uncharacterized ferritin-like protein (DUF455 family)